MKKKKTVAIIDDNDDVLFTVKFGIEETEKDI